MSDKLTLNDFLQALKRESTYGELFIDFHMVRRSDGVNISKYILSKGYYFEYDCLKKLWVELSSIELINRIENWTRVQSGILARDQTNFKDLAEFYKVLDKVTKVKYLDGVVKSITSYIKDDDIFDKLDKIRPELLPIKGGRVINLQNKKVRERSISDYFTYECQVEPVEEYSDFFYEAMSSIMCDKEDRLEYFQKVMGYCLTGSKEAQSYFIWYGKGSNGKSLILNLLQAVLGKACSPISKSVIVDCGKKGGNGSEMISLKDLRLGTFSETNSNESLNEGMLKTISGGDKIRARALYKEEISFELIVKLIVCTNQKPEFNGADHGTTRRIKLLPFEAKFVSKDPRKAKNEYRIIENLERTLIDQYLDEFFTFCLEGAVMWFNDKKFDKIPACIKEQQDEYIAEQNSFGSWFSDFIKPNDGYKLDRAESWKSYFKVTDERGFKPLSKKDFFNKLNEECGKPMKTHGIFVYRNFTLIEEEDT
jgi:P4 family phage/plasmid primase-like protien